MASSAVFMNIISVFLYVMLLLYHHHQIGQANRIQMELFEEPDSPSPGPAPNTTSTTIDCGSACGVRCKLSSRPNLCMRACGTCCKRCNCVPPGTHDHYEFCPCYYNQTTHGGARKCP